MARPQATILMKKQLSDYLSVEVLAASALYAVVYKSQPFNLKQRYWNARGELIKYPKTTFPNQAPADNLADKLNREFFTTDFTVVKIL